VRTSGLDAEKRGAARASDLPEHHVQIRNERPDGPPVRPRRKRLLLYTFAESDQRCGSGQNRRARRRCRRDAHLVGTGSELLRRPEPLFGGRPFCQRSDRVRRHVQPFRRHDGQDGYRSNLYRPGCFRGRDRRSFPPQHETAVRRNDHEPRRRGARHREIRTHSTQPRRTADRRQHLRHADQLPPVRVGRRHRDAFDHKIHGRPRHGGRRRDRRQRQFRLGSARG